MTIMLLKYTCTLLRVLFSSGTLCTSNPDQSNMLLKKADTKRPTSNLFRAYATKGVLLTFNHNYIVYSFAASFPASTHLAQQQEHDNDVALSYLEMLNRFSSFPSPYILSEFLLAFSPFPENTAEKKGNINRGG